MTVIVQISSGSSNLLPCKEEPFSLWTEISSVLKQPAARIKSTFNDLRNAVTDHIDRVWPSTSPVLFDEIKEKLPLLKKVSGVLKQPELDKPNLTNLKDALIDNTRYVWPLIKKVDLSKPLNKEIGVVQSFLVRWGAIPVVSVLPECAQSWILKNTPDYFFNKGFEKTKEWLKDDPDTEGKNDKKSIPEGAKFPDSGNPMHMAASLLKASNNEAEIKKVLKDYLPALENLFESPKYRLLLKNLLGESGYNNFEKEYKFIFDDGKEILSNLKGAKTSDSRKREIVDSIINSELIKFIVKKKEALLEINFSEEEFVKKLHERLEKILPEEYGLFVEIMFLKRFDGLSKEDKLKFYTSFLENINVDKDEIKSNGPNFDEIENEMQRNGLDLLGIGAQKLIQQLADQIQSGDELTRDTIKNIFDTLKQDVKPMSPEDRELVIKDDKNKILLSGIRFRNKKDKELLEAGTIREPIKAGTIGEVHFGKNEKGQDVVVKILRHNIADTVDDKGEKKEGKISEEFYGYAESLKSKSEHIPEKYKKMLKFFEGTLDSLKKSIDKETNFEDEANNTRTAKKIYETSSNGYQIKIPEVYDSNKNIMIQQRVEGDSLQAILKSNDYKNKSVEKKKEFLSNASDLLKLEVEQWMKGVVRHGFVEADRHDGNTLYNEKEKTFYMIDFGASSTLDQEKKQLYKLRLMGTAFQFGRPKAFRKGLAAFVNFPESKDKKQQSKDKKQLDKEIAQCFSGLTVLFDNEPLPTQGVNDVVIQKKSGKGEEILVRIFNKNGQYADVTVQPPPSEHQQSEMAEGTEQKLPEDVGNAIKLKLDGKSKLSDQNFVKYIKSKLPHYFAGLILLDGDGPLPTRGLNDLVIQRKSNGQILVRIFDKKGVCTDSDYHELQNKLPEDLLEKIALKIKDKDNKDNGDNSWSDQDLIKEVISGLNPPPLVEKEVQFIEVLNKIMSKVLVGRGLAAPESLMQLVRGATCLGGRIDDLNDSRRKLGLPIMDVSDIFHKAAIKASMDMSTVSDVTKMAYRGIKKKALNAFNKISKRVTTQVPQSAITLEK